MRPWPGSGRRKASVLSWHPSSINCKAKKQGSPSRRNGCRPGRRGSTGSASRTGTAKTRSIPTPVPKRRQLALSIRLPHPRGSGRGSDLVVLVARQAVLVRNRRPQRGEGLLVLRSLIIWHRYGPVAGIGPVVGAASVRDLVLRPVGEVLVSLAGCLPGRGEVLQHRCGQGRAVR